MGERQSLSSFKIRLPCFFIIPSTGSQYGPRTASIGCFAVNHFLRIRSTTTTTTTTTTHRYDCVGLVRKKSTALIAPLCKSFSFLVASHADGLRGSSRVPAPLTAPLSGAGTPKNVCVEGYLLRRLKR